MFDPTAEERELRRIEVRVAAGASGARRSHRARRVAIVTAVAAVFVIASGSYFVIRAAERDVERTAVCYSAAALDARSTSVQLIDSATNRRTGQASVEARADPIAMCTAVWVGGAIRDDAGVRQPLPSHLAACILPSDEPAVFPQGEKKDVCKALGLASYPQK